MQQCLWLLIALRLLWTTLLLTGFSVVAQAAPKRVALLIGNSQYQHEKFLPNPKNDVADLAVALRKLGFDVVVAENQGKIDMEVAINRFVERSNQASTALVFYAGHGALTRKEGQAFLLPVDAKVTDDATLQASGVGVADVLKRLEQTPSPAQLRLVVVDACRTVQSVQRGGDRGLGRGPMPNDQTLLAYSTSEGSPADDGIGRNSPYAGSLIKHLPRLANERVLDVFDDVKKDVLKATDNKQKPEKFTQMDARVSLDGVELLNLNPEQTQWVAAVRSNTDAAYVEYLRAYPNGQYSGVAKNALAALRPSEVRPPEAKPAAVAAPVQNPALSAASATAAGSALIDGRYQVLGDGSEVKDVQTGLVWARCSVGQSWDGKTCGGQPKFFSFDDTQKLVSTGWRVPTVRELSSLIHCGSGNHKGVIDLQDGGAPVPNKCEGSHSRPTVKDDAFPNTAYWYWTSSPMFGNTYNAWGVYFYSGDVLQGYNRNVSYNVRLVRTPM